MKKKDGISKEHLLYIRKLKLETVIVWMLRIFLLIFLLGLWELLARTGVMDPFITSYPSEILVTIKELFAEELQEENAKGLERGKAEGIRLAKLIFRLSAQGNSEEEIAGKCGISLEQVREILE